MIVGEKAQSFLRLTLTCNYKVIDNYGETKPTQALNGH